MDNETEIFEDTLESFPNHRRLLRRAVNQFRDDSRVDGLLLGGSLANEDISIDRYSDIDLYIVVRDEDFDAVLDDRRAAAESVGAPLFQYVPDHLPNGDRQYGALYEELVKFDFMYRRASALSPEWKWARCRVLDDTAGFLAELVAESQEYSLEAPSAERLQRLNQKFWTWCWDIFGFIERGELWTAVASVHSLRSTFLLPLLAWATETPAYGYRRLESKMDRKFADRLESTLAQRKPENLREALQSGIELYDELRNDVFSRYDVPYDSEAEAVVREEIRVHRTDEQR
jgi:predicted nucleotidyltransferase